MLRAAIVFTGAGIDSTLKQLLRDALPDLLESSKLSSEKFRQFAESHIGDEAGDVNTKRLAAVLISPSPRQALIEQYLRQLTGESLQSVEQVSAVAGALGIEQPDLRRDIQSLKALFEARNQVVHELDLRDPAQHGNYRRRARSIEPVTQQCNAGLALTQRLVNEVAHLLA
jgi:hypothetical protein